MTVAIEQRKGGLRIVGSGGGGKGGGGSARTPVEYPDSAHSTSYAVLLDAIGNGEMFGPVHASQPLRDIYLDGTPIQNADGSLNFSHVEVEYRTGTVDQTHIPGFPASSSVTNVGVEVKTSTPWTQAITNTDLSAVRVTLYWPQLVRVIDTGSNYGDRVGTTVNYAIDLATDGGSFQNVLNTNVSDKARGYARTHRIDLPSSASGWTIRVRRLTQDSTSDTVTDAFSVQSYAEVIDGKFRYPMTALVGMKVSAEQFSSIPTRSYHWRGQIIRVPSNYDPASRTYSGVWDGTFKRAWSNNPAWVYFDILTSKLYGLGDRIDASMIDRYALYQIGAYCDQLVDDGMGGQEPRFVCNVYLQSQADALRVLNDLTSTFRGMAYWANGQVVAVADAPSDPVYTYTNGNVVDGRFEYTGADISTLKTVALVSWNDPTDFYRSKVEVVNDDAGILRYGIRKTNVVAFGCTSRGQAQRVGLYHLYTSRMQTGGVGFSVGLDGVIPQPGSIVKIADRNRAGRHIGGRIRQATASTVTLDRDHPIKVGDTLTVNMPDGSTQSRPVSGVSGRVITVSPAFSQAPTAESAWAVDADDLVTQHVRVVSVKDEGGITFSMSGVFHHPGKFDAIDSGVRLDPLPVSVVPPRAQRAPSNIQITQHHTFHQGTTRQYAEITWDAPEYAATYDVQWRRDNGEWVQMPRTGARLVQIEDIYSGIYIVRVRAINALDVPSLWAYSDATDLDGIIGEPPTVAFLSTAGEVQAIRLDWGYSAAPSIVAKVEIRASLTNDFTDSYALTSVAFPSTSYTLYGLGYKQQMWFWVRLVDKNGTAGAWYPSETGAGQRGETNDNPADLLDYLEGEIGKSQLAQGLVTEIEDVSDRINVLDTLPIREIEVKPFAPQTGLVSVVRNLSSSISAIGKKTDSISEALLAAALKVQGNTELLYDAGVQVDSSTGQVYIFGVKQAEDRLDAAEIRLDAAESSINLKASTTYVDEAILNAVIDPTQLPELGGLTARIGQAEVDISGLDAAIALKADLLTVQDQEIRLGQAEIDIDALQSEIVLKASNTELDAVESRVSTAETTLSALDVASITQTVTDVRVLKNYENELAQTQLQDILTGEKNLRDLEGGIAFATQEMKAYTDGVALSEAQARLVLAAQLSGVQAALVQESTVRATEDTALASQIDTLQTAVGNNTAAIQTETQTRADADSALASDITTLQTQTSDNSAAIQSASSTLATLQGDVESTYQVKAQVNANGKVVQTGFALGAAIGKDGSAKSEFYVMADRFAVLSSFNAAPKPMFVVEGPNVFMDTAFIKDGVITSAKIEDASITTAKIADGNITNAKIEDGAITTAKIGDAQINTAKIGHAAVDTLKIAGQSVTTSVGVIFPAYVSGYAYPQSTSFTVSPVDNAQLIIIGQDSSSFNNRTTINVAGYGNVMEVYGHPFDVWEYHDGGEGGGWSGRVTHYSLGTRVKIVNIAAGTRTVTVSRPRQSMLVEIVFLLTQR